MSIDFVAHGSLVDAKERGVGKWDAMKKALGFGVEEEFFEEWIPVTGRWTATDANHSLGFLKEVSTSFSQYLGYVDLLKIFFNKDLLESYGFECGQDEQGMDVDEDFERVIPIFEMVGRNIQGLFRVMYLALVNSTSLWGEQQISDQDQRKLYTR